MLMLKKVTEPSMVPVLNPGDWIVMVRRPFCKVRRGDLVLIEHPLFGNLLKKVDGMLAGKVSVIANQPEGMDSRTFGLVDMSWIKGKLLFKIPLGPRYTEVMVHSA